ncbi:MAG: hypothetical protein IPO78_10200 [Saprospiraceae bacterium]|nr:hypothetical protein [Saprospiraceae bacterium]
MKGNIILYKEEIQNLRTALVERYSQLTGQSLTEPDNVFNSNMANYEGLYESMDKLVSLNEHGTHSVKPLLSLFYLSKRNSDEGKSFRRRFIDCVYMYIYGHKREGTFPNYKNLQTQTQNSYPLDNLKGYWECYYSLHNTLQRKFEVGTTLHLNTIAINIQPENKNGDQLRYIRSNRDYGKGTIEIFDSNVIFKLRNEIDNSISILFMNCGKGTIQNSLEHLDLLSGIYTIPAQRVEGIKGFRCIMLYKNSTQVENKYQSTDFNLENENVKSLFLSEYQKYQ